MRHNNSGRKPPNCRKSRIASKTRHTSSDTQGQPRLATWLTIRSLRRPQRRASVRTRAVPESTPYISLGAGTRSSSGVARPCSPTDAVGSGELERSRCQAARPSLGRRAILRCVTERGHLVDSLESRTSGSRWAATASTCISPDALSPPCSFGHHTHPHESPSRRRCACCSSDPRHVRGRSIRRSCRTFESFANIWLCVIAGFAGSPSLAAHSEDESDSTERRPASQCHTYICRRENATCAIPPGNFVWEPLAPNGKRQPPTASSGSVAPRRKSSGRII